MSTKYTFEKVRILIEIQIDFLLRIMIKKSKSRVTGVLRFFLKFVSGSWIGLLFSRLLKPALFALLLFCSCSPYIKGYVKIPSPPPVTFTKNVLSDRIGALPNFGILVSKFAAENMIAQGFEPSNLMDPIQIIFFRKEIEINYSYVLNELTNPCKVIEDIKKKKNVEFILFVENFITFKVPINKITLLKNEKSVFLQKPVMQQIYEVKFYVYRLKDNLLVGKYDFNLCWNNQGLGSLSYVNKTTGAMHLLKDDGKMDNTPFVKINSEHLAELFEKGVSDLVDFMYIETSIDSLLAIGVNKVYPPGNNSGYGSGLFGSFGCNDNDDDGIVNNLDDCPDIPGIISGKGCPDNDGDGIPNEMDLCPEVKGRVEYQGCEDTDQDGVLDHVDRCPQEKGPWENSGCPWGDKDNDGVPDNLDFCPKDSGDVSNNGCPLKNIKVPVELKELATKVSILINFEETEPILKNQPEAIRMMNQLADKINISEHIALTIYGFCNNQENFEKNNDCSEELAKSVKAFFINLQVDPKKISYNGLGDAVPEGESAMGNPLRRKVTLSLYYIQK